MADDKRTTDKTFAEEVIQPLRDWLVENRARCLWSVSIERVGDISLYSVGPSQFLIQTYKDGGWEVFAPFAVGCTIPQTLRDLGIHCGFA